MIRKLFIVAASGLVLALVCLAGAWAIGGRELIRNGGWTFDIDGGNSGPHEKRALTFDAAVPLVIEAPVDFHFTRGETVSMVVSGQPDVMRALVWKDGRLSLDGQHKFGDGGLTVKLVAPILPSFALEGPGNVELRDLRQPSLTLTMNGVGNIEASGKVDKLSVDTSGAGNLDLEGLEATDAEVDLSGLGNADISTTGRLDVDVSGAGNVSLHRKPREIHAQISGLGNVSHDY